MLLVTEWCNQHWLPCRHQLQVEQRTLYKRELDKIMNRYTKNLFWAAFFGSIWFKQKVGRVYLICRIILRIIGWGRYVSKDTGQGLVWFYSQGTKSQGFYVNCGEFQKMSGECGGRWVFKLFLSCYPPNKEWCGEKKKRRRGDGWLFPIEIEGQDLGWIPNVGNLNFWIPYRPFCYRLAIRCG